MLGHEILGDAGTVVGDLTAEQMLRIDIVEPGNEDATMGEIWKAAEGFEAERAERVQVFQF